MSVLCCLKRCKGKLNVYDSKYTLSFELDQSHTLVTCVLSPYILMKGTIERHPNITCEHYILHTFINTSVLLTVTSKSLYILGASPSVCRLAKLSMSWQDSPVLILAQKLTERILIDHVEWWG